MKLEVGLLIKVMKSHMAITTTVNIIGLELNELLLVLTVENWSQGTALRIETGEVVHIISLDPITEMPVYIEAL